MGVPLLAVFVVRVVKDGENRCLVSAGVRNADRQKRFNWRSGLCRSDVRILGEMKDSKECM
jgi:hypothetical protein